MCLISKTDELKLAKKDIYCYKYGLKISDTEFSPFYHQYYIYNKGVLQQKVEIDPFRNRGMFEVHRGYHAYKLRGRRPPFAYLFMIPKGTKYLEGEYNDIVAENIIYLGEIEEQKLSLTKQIWKLLKTKIWKKQ